MKIDLNKAKKDFNSPTSAFIEMMGGGGNTENGVKKIPIEKLEPFPAQKTFHFYRGDKLQELAESIKADGVISPIIVRPLKDDKFQILAGHNRTAAAKMAGLDDVPAIVKNVDDNTANEIFVYTNLEQREKLLPSEKAAAYKLLMNSENDTECRFDTAEKIAQHKGESRRQIFRYLTLCKLIEPLMKLVDSGELPFNAGVTISAYDDKSQWLLNDYISSHKIKITLKKSEELRKQSNDNELTYEVINNVFRKNKKVSGKIKLPLDGIRVYFGDASDEEIRDKVIEIVKEHFDGSI